MFGKSFQDSGLVLQDIVNEFGRRLDFDVENGLYRGKAGAVGFDGIWRAKNEPDLIIEVKTTDYVAMDLKTHAGYKERLLLDNRVTKDVSTLIVVGREDTGALEAQIRGSRYAWEMRLISVERLIRLVQIKEKSDDAAIVNQIRQLLQPFEYTKIDRIIDVIFTTAVNVESQQQIEQQILEDEISEIEPGKQERTNLELLNAKRQQAVDAFSKLKGNWSNGALRYLRAPTRSSGCAAQFRSDMKATINLIGTPIIRNGMISWQKEMKVISSFRAWIEMKRLPYLSHGFKQTSKI